jgi:hypothetical protein
VLILSTFDAEIDFADVHEELFFVVFVQAIADLAVLFVVASPLTLSEKVISFLDLLHFISHRSDRLRLFL